MRIAVGSDHAGYALKTEIVAHLVAAGHDVDDLGTDSGEVSVDYPVYGQAVGEAVAGGRAERGVCVCGTGIGIGIANVLCMGERTTGRATALDTVDAFFTVEFEGGRHQRRLDQIRDQERQHATT
jgi:ribose 5-phosphate isomerase B